MLSKSNKYLLCFLSVSSVVFLLLSCKEKTASTTALAAYDTEEFKAFYEQFSNDSTFQMQHIVFPLEGRKRLIDSTEVHNPDFRWEEKDWLIHKSFDDMNGTFTRTFWDVSGIVIENISDTSETYLMERRFGKLSSGWHLIYYQEMDKVYSTEQ